LDILSVKKEAKLSASEVNDVEVRRGDADLPQSNWQICQPTWYSCSPDASAPGRRSASGKQVAELIVECCAANATRQNSWRQSAGLETSCWGQRQCRCL